MKSPLNLYIRTQPMVYFLVGNRRKVPDCGHMWLAPIGSLLLRISSYGGDINMPPI